MENITNQFDSFSIDIKNNCICCHNKYIIDYDYEHCDKLCIICYDNYKTFMFEDNKDYVEIL